MALDYCATQPKVEGKLAHLMRAPRSSTVTALSAAVTAASYVVAAGRPCRIPGQDHMLAQELLGLVGQPGEVLQDGVDGVDGELLGVRMLKIGYPRARALAKRIVIADESVPMHCLS